MAALICILAILLEGTLLDDDWDKCPPEEELQEIICEPSSDKCKCTAADTPLLAWIPEHQAFLDETLHLEGHGSPGSPCCCGAATPLFRCHDCFGTQMFCHECMLNSHTYNPLHRIDMWNGSFFQCTTLKQMGLCVQLGHHPGKKCYNPQPSSSDDFVIIDVHGV
ncbi:hypothetical protein AZE42_13608, partial [Rhizopogon vesiculosus]